MSSNARGARPTAAHDGIVRAGAEVRGTQSFVQVMASVWRRPSLVALEVLWRWGFGIVALWLLGTNAWRIWLGATHGSGDPARLGLDRLTVNDPMGTAAKIGDAMAQVLPATLHTSRWMAPLLFVLWTIAAGLGHSAVMRRLDPGLERRHGSVMLLGMARLLFLAAAFALWFFALTRAGSSTVSGPVARGEEPNLVLYFALAITATLLLFVAWAAASWVLSIAPMLSMLRNLTAAQSLRAATRLGPLRAKLFEINLVMGIVKVALVVLAMVFSATPLPFETYTTGTFLWGWWAGVTLLYLLASDFFHVVRMAAYLALWRAYDAG